VRVTLEPLSATPADDTVRIAGPAGPLGVLWTSVLAWRCQGQLLQLQLLAAEPVALPAYEASEPASGALARLQQALLRHGGLLVLRNPAAAFSPERIALASGVRLFAVADPADEACWDAALSLGQPVYGLRGVISCSVATAHPAAVISALAYGNFCCEEGLTLERLEEDRSGVRLAARLPIAAAVIVRGGFEAARLQGAEVRWDDQGNEGYVRVVARATGGCCWTQPRFIAPRQPGAAAGLGQGPAGGQGSGHGGG
jgi:hypothetical protein